MKRPNFLLLLISLFVAFVLALQVFVLQQPEAVIEEPVHFHAGFAVVRDGTFVDFSGPQYMHLDTCDEEGSAHDEIDPVEEQLEKAHLHDNVGDVAHVHREDVTWRDLFQNLNYTLPDDVIAFQNEEIVGDPLDALIHSYDRILFFTGAPEMVPLLFDQYVPTVDRIKTVEAEGESC